MRFMVSFKERLSYNLGLIYILSYQILLLSCGKRKKGQRAGREALTGLMLGLLPRQLRPSKRNSDGYIHMNNQLLLAQPS